MSAAKRSGQRIILAATAALVAASAVAVGGSAAHADACTLVRPYGLTNVSNDKAVADAHGYHGPLEPVDQASMEWSLTLTSEQAEQLQDAIAGGCTPTVAFSTRGTVIAFGAGSTASFQGDVSVAVAGSTVGSVSAAGSFPLDSCLTAISCQENLNHTVDTTAPAPAGATVTVSTIGQADAAVVIANQFHQAHGDFSVRFPVLRIPIP